MRKRNGKGSPSKIHGLNTETRQRAGLAAQEMTIIERIPMYAIYVRGPEKGRRRGGEQARTRLAAVFKPWRRFVVDIRSLA